MLKNAFDKKDLFAVRTQCGIGATVKNPNGHAKKAEGDGQRRRAD
ncbi:hypothetical protein QDR26_21590 [Xanthomonas perforans]|nr:hypothetical protein [Xanthomonas perforans]